MKDNVLKREFEEKDVQRLRNLVQGKYGDKSGNSVGYTKKEFDHKEGDVWEEDDRQWTIEDGILQNITKLDEAKKINLMPLFCPSCSRIMNKRFDKDYFKIHAKCYDCVIEFETELRRLGLYEEYENNLHNSEIEGFIDNFKTFMEEHLNSDEAEFITEVGDLETWAGGVNKELALESIDKTIKYLKGLKRT